MRAYALALVMMLGCLPEMPESPTLDAGSALPLRDAGRTVTPPPPPIDAGPRDVGFGELSLIGLTPNQGPASGGTRVQLRGVGFLPDTVVELGGLPVRDVLVISSRALTFFTPAGQVGAADLRVQNAFGTAEISAAFSYFQPLQPRELTPREGPLNGGIELRLSGEGLSDETVVLFGGRPWLNQRLEGDDLVGVLPPGARAGAVDLRVADAYGQVHWRAAFSYLAAPFLTGLSPARVAPGDTVDLRLEGVNFCLEPDVVVGQAPCPDLQEDERGLFCRLSVPEQEAILAVEMTCPGGSTQAEPGLVVIAEQGSPLLLAVEPAYGRLSGGEQVTLIGRGLSDVDLEWDHTPIVGLLPNARGMMVVTPPSERAERIDIGAGEAGVLLGAFAYRDPLYLRGIDPVSGPASGGSTVQIFGDGFCAEPEVLFDGIAQEILASEPRQITVRTRPHPGGTAPIVVRCGAQTASRFNGFFFSSDLALVGISPTRGAQAGGTEIFIVGRGLRRPGLEVRLGVNVASDVTIISDRLLRAKTPPGVGTGPVDLTVSVEGQQAVTEGAFTYYDPGFRYGGSRGGTPQGSINVTVLNSWGMLAPIGGANVVVGGTTREQRLVGVTNSSGQVTLSDPSLFGPQTVTVYKDGCDQTRTLVDVDAADLTFWLGCMGEPSQGGGGGTPPPPLQPLTISGRILGFDKAIFDPGRLGPNQRAFAQVRLTQSSPHGAGGWVNGQDFVFEDGGEYRIVLPSGRYTLVAIAGIHNSRTQEVVELTQLGFRRQVTGPPGEHLQHQDIDLSYPMDASYGVSLGDHPAPLPSMQGADRMRVRVALDFGGEGFFPLADEMSRGAFILLRGLPRVAADMLYVSGGLVTGDGGASPSSTIRVRGSGRLSGGITLGPLLPFAERIAPRQEGALLADRMLRWKFGDGPIRPDYVWVDISDSEGRNWELMLRGSQNKLRLPILPHGTVGLGRPGRYYAQVTAVANPRFDFDNFSYLDTWYNSWQALSERSISFELD